MRTANDYFREVFGEKLYKISLDAGFTCPNRDGIKGDRGCIFCSAGGSGDFSERIIIDDPGLLEAQLLKAKERIGKKYKGNRYIAYFQAYTNTYASAETLKKIYFPIAEREDIAGLDIATRPDCLGDDVLEVLGELQKKKPLIVELGLQTIHEKTAGYIRRGYPLKDYDRAISILKEMGIHTVTHVILGLPGESGEDMTETVRYVVRQGSAGIKLQLLHVLKGTDLYRDYEAGKFEVLSMEAYRDILRACLREIPEEMVVHRITGDGPKALLAAPLWSADKKQVLNYLKRELELD